jgi:hypothetical protein
LFDERGARNWRRFSSSFARFVPRVRRPGAAVALPPSARFGAQAWRRLRSIRQSTVSPAATIVARRSASGARRRLRGRDVRRDGCAVSVLPSGNRVAHAIARAAARRRHRWIGVDADP